MPTAAEVQASKAAQVEEATTRQDQIAAESGGNRNVAQPTTIERASPIYDPIEPPAEQIEQPRAIEPQESQEQPRGRPKPIPMSPADLMRAEISKRFRHDDEGRVPYNGNPNDPEMLYGVHGRDRQFEVPPAPPTSQEPLPPPEQKPAPRMITMKVRGREITKSEDEWFADAAKVTAADSYLEESRSMLEQVRNLKRGNGDMRSPESQHPETNRTQDYQTQDYRTDPSLAVEPNPEDELEGAIEDIKYGPDSKNSASKIRAVIAKEADRAADARQMQRLVQQDHARSQDALKQFTEANKDIANDERAAQFIENEIYRIQREELGKMSDIDLSHVGNSADLAHLHRNARIYGRNVSTPLQMLEKAKGALFSFRGSKSSQVQPPREAAPRIEVNVNRDDRRANLPLQPTRSTMPPPTQAQSQQGPRDRSDVISQMRKARGQIV